MKAIKSRFQFFVWGISIAIVGLIDPEAALKGIVQALKETNKIK